MKPTRVHTSPIGSPRNFAGKDTRSNVQVAWGLRALQLRSMGLTVRVLRRVIRQNGS